MPSVTYAQTNSAAPEINTSYQLCGSASCEWEFPVYSNATGGAYQIAADVASFTYDAVGNMLTADNGAATVKRSYYPTGGLETDSLIFKDGSGSKYGLAFTYDLDGRRKTLSHPSNLSLGTGVQSYDYENFGPVWKTTSVLGHVYEYGYDNDGRVTSFSFPFGSETYLLDHDGRRTERTLTVNGTPRYRDAFTQDQRGRILTVDPVGAPASAWQATMSYSGLGHLVLSEFSSPNAPFLREEFRSDAQGNREWSSTYTPTMACNDPQETELQYVTGRLFSLSGAEAWPTCLPVQNEMYQDTTVQRQDASGNVERTGKEEWFTPEPESQWVYWEGAWNYYGADQKLRARQVYRDSVEHITTQHQPVRARGGVWEEYQYDALGRRIRREIDRGPEICQSLYFCFGSTERYVWDGEELLYETRSGGAGAAQNGTVGYTHGLGIDAPLDIMRQGYSYTTNRAVVPHTNWRGAFDSGTFADNGTAFDCVVLGCGVAWPAGNQSAFMYDGTAPPPADWFGSLLDSHRDESGLMFRRNRYYDPATGQFTQQDPIGLAGGLNLYGFADGDPVNFGDPFGLEPCEINDYLCLTVRAIAQIAGGLGGFAAGFSAGGGAGLSCTVGAVVCSPALAAVGGISGSIVGAQAAGELFDAANVFSMAKSGRAGKESTRDPLYEKYRSQYNPNREQRGRIHDLIEDAKKGGDLDDDAMREIFEEVMRPTGGG